MTADTGY